MCCGISPIPQTLRQARILRGCQRGMPLTRDSILEIARTLPPGLREFAELEELLRSESEPPLDEVADLIKRDADLSRTLIQVSNSVAFRGEQRTGSVTEALARLGLKEAFLIAVEVAMRGWWDEPLPFYGVSASALRQHCLRVAFYGERLAAGLHLDERVGYTAGMMCPLGMVVLERAAQQQGNVAPFDETRDRDFRTWEIRTFGCEAGEVGAWVLTQWGIAPAVVEAIRCQRLSSPAELQDRMACVLNLARGAAAAHGDPLRGETPHWTLTPEKLAAVGFSAAAFGLTMTGIQEEFRRAAEHPLRRALEAQRRPHDDIADSGRAGENSCNFRPGSRVLSTNDAPSVHNSEAGVSPAPDFTTFMRNYQNMVFSTAARLTGNDAQAEDISQEVFLKAYQNYDHLRTSPTAGGWLKTVATNLSLNHLSRYRKRWRFFSEFKRDSDAGDAHDAPEVDFAAPDTFFSDIDSEDRRVLVEEALAQLPSNQRVPLVLYHSEDMPYDEIARKLGVSLAKVKTDILRARVALAKILARPTTTHETFRL